MSANSTRKKREERRREVERELKRELKRLSGLSTPLPGGDDQSQGPTNDNADSQPNARGNIIGFSPKQLAIGLLVWGASAFVNYISSDPRVLYFCFFAVSAWLLWLFWKRGRVWKWLYVPIIVGLFFCTHIFITSKLPDYLPVSLEVGPTLNPAKPFETKLILRNPNPRPIQDVKYISYWHDPDAPMKRSAFSSFGMISRSLGAAKQLAFELSDSPPITNTIVKRGSVTVQVMYSFAPKSAEITNSFQFSVIANDTGGYVWLPAGDGISLHELKARIEVEPLRFLHQIPLLVVEKMAVTKLDPRTNGRNLKMHYELRNIGGVPATDLYVEWGVICQLAPGLDTFIYWTNYWPANFKTETIWPGSVRPMSTTYRHQQGPWIDQILLEGRSTWIGTMHYKDIDTNEYWMRMRAFFTNNQFEVLYFDHHGRFGTNEWRISDDGKLR